MKIYVKSASSSKKYYVTRTTDGKVEYKRTKTLNYWSPTPEGCWEYSKQGAKGIVEDYNSRLHPTWRDRIHYDMQEVAEDTNDVTRDNS